MSVYPSNIPTTGDLPDAGANLSSNPHSSLHDDVRDEVIAIAGELGVEPSGTASTVRARLDDGLGLREIVTFTSNGTFTKASYPWLRAVRVRVVGGGAAGRPKVATGASEAAAGPGGGAGGYCESFFDVDDLDATESVTVASAASSDNAGTASLFKTMSAGGGSLGDVAVATSGIIYRTGGLGGVATGGQINADGNPGRGSLVLGNLSSGYFPGEGGASVFGGGGRSGTVGVTPTAQVGDSGKAFGAGGAGGFGRGSIGASAGGAGNAGLVILELYA
jgi:hypothetical protein